MRPFVLLDLDLRFLDCGCGWRTLSDVLQRYASDAEGLLDHGHLKLAGEDPSD